MLKGIKKLVNRLKFTFKGANEQEFEFNGPEIECLSKDDQVIDIYREEDFTEVNRGNGAKEFNPSEYCFEIAKLGKNKKTFLLRGLYGKDKAHLIHILVNTRKPRVRKKLIKRILN